MQKVKANIIGLSESEKERAISLLTNSFSNLNDSEYTVLPGFCDVHVHFREPGFSYKETIKTGSLAGAHGGYTTVFTMPNLKPVPDSVENIKKQLKIIESDAVIEVYPYASITVGQLGKELAGLDGLAKYSIAFSDDGKGVQTDEMMKRAMLKAKALNKIIVAHCEVESLLFGGYIHDGEYCKTNGHKGICSASEYEMVKRDIELVKETGSAYHVCHVSTKESVELIRQAKKQGLNVSGETAPHYLVLDDSMLKEDGKWKMNPPIRSKEDRLALIEGVLDGTLEIIATDHAPHSNDEKSKGLKGSPFGIVGLETAFPIMYTHFVKTGVMSLEKLIELLAVNPRKRFGLKEKGFSVWKLNEEYEIDPSEFLSQGKATPFEGEKVFGKCYLTAIGDKAVYKK
ncbi:MAG: dihydroorotase [Clostridia bacterium]|nr:dihydroorotase [Clostridia bacterium]